MQRPRTRVRAGDNEAAMMVTHDGKGSKGASALLCMAVLIGAFLSLVLVSVHADPNGATIAYNSTGSRASQDPENRSDERGTITTLILSAIQQDQHWKGYVGNVTGSLTLDDADGYTIYDWDLTGVTITGRVYATRNSSPSWSAVSCADYADIVAEETFHNMTYTEADSINKTFNYSLHDAFFVGITPFAADTCPSTATYLNSTRQDMLDSGNTSFQEVIIEDEVNVIWVALLESDLGGYRDDGTPYDFQMIVPESDIKASPTTYYFFTEIGS